MNKPVAIVGSHPDTRHLAPFDDPDIDIWVFNEAATCIEPKTKELWAKRVDAVFQMHSPQIYRSSINRNDPHHWEWLQQSHGYPVYMQAVDPAAPDSVAYPLDDLIADLHCDRYFTNSISYGIALAIYQRRPRILIYGIEMASETEYQYQRDCIAYWLGFAQGRGIIVERHSANAIFSRPLYGYDGMIYQDIESYRNRANYLAEWIADERSKVGKREHELHTCYREAQHPGDAIANLLEASKDLGELEGRASENDRYLYKLLEMDSTGMARFIDRNEFEGAGAKVKADIEKYGAEVHRSAGRLDYVLHVWTVTRSAQSLEQTKLFAKTNVDAGYNLGKSLGIHEENRERALELDDNIKAAGGEKAIEYLQAADGLPAQGGG